MSIITDFLKLFKYDPETDGASTFNIKQCLNDNWDKIDAWASGIKTTIAGLVPGTRKVNGKELSADVTLTGEDIKTSASDETTISSQLSNVVRVNPGYGNGLFGNDLNDWKRLGTFDTIGNNPDPVTLNVPPETDGWGIVTVLSAKDTEIEPTIQLFQPLNNIAGGVRPLFYRFFRDTWTEWKPIAIATPPQEHAIVPKNGAQLRPGYKNSYSKDQFGHVVGNFAFAFTNFLANGTSIFALPQEFCPNASVDAVAWCFDTAGNNYCCDILITPDGEAAINYSIPSGQTVVSLHGAFVF